MTERKHWLMKGLESEETEDEPQQQCSGKYGTPSKTPNPKNASQHQCHNQRYGQYCEKGQKVNKS
ncbi:MAG: hypothetical protein MUD03_12615 [Pirellula sp.]|nr:hypothetical protein [Pirellula sp.]